MPDAPTGSLAVDVAGLPTGVAASVQLDDGDGQTRVISASSKLSGLAAGTFVLRARSIVVDGDVYSPSPVTQTIVVSAGPDPALAAVTYAISTGSLVVSTSGTPPDQAPTISVSGPGGYQASVTAGTILKGLTPGMYTVTPQPVRVDGSTYVASADPASVEVRASVVPATLTLSYAPTTGALAITVAGLPAGVNAEVHVTGPAGFATTLVASATLPDLDPGEYTLSAVPVSVASSSYEPLPPVQLVDVAASPSPVPVTVTYAMASGSLSLAVSGLPGGVEAAVTVSGPDGYTAPLTGSGTLSALVPGAYTVSAASVPAGANTYVPAPVTQTVQVSTSGTTTASVTYNAATSLNLAIGGLYITQAVQTSAMDVPLVAGRDGLLRVFVTASEANSARPAVRVRVYQGATLVDTRTITAPGSSVPTSVNEGELSASWNVLLPGAELQPGTRLLVDVDPANTIEEASESDNTFPSSGTPLALDVRTVSTYGVRLVPVAQSVNGNTGRVSTANKAQFVSVMLQMFPLASIDADVRATYTTSAPALQSGDGNNAWEQILSEVNALRTADGSTRGYYGVVHTSYTSGVAGLGYVPGHTAIGWDYLPSGAQVMAHETGHNFGRLHAPSCGAGGTDPSFPYGGGRTGVYGYDLASGTLRSPAAWYDLMGYCNPVWISDYTYEGILDYRSAHPDVVTAGTSGVVQSTLLVWGRVHGGELTLEPAYEVATRPRLPVGGGPSTLAGYAGDGTRLFSMAFAGERVADAPDPDDQTFAFAIPVDSLHGRSLARLTLRALGKTAERRASGLSGEPVIRSALEEPAARRTGAGQVLVTWTDDGVRGVLVRDAVTGEILSFGRGGSASVRTTSGALDVTLSDGVRSVHRRLTPR